MHVKNQLLIEKGYITYLHPQILVEEGLEVKKD